MSEERQIADCVPSAGATLESLAWLIHHLDQVASKDVMAHLLGVREFVRAIHQRQLNEERTHG